MANAPESNAAVVPPPRRRRAPRSRSMPDPERPIQQQRELERRRQAYFEGTQHVKLHFIACNGNFLYCR